MKKHLITLAIALFIYNIASDGQVPKTMSYQGVLQCPKGQNAPDGLYHMRFTIYRGTDLIWLEDQDGANKVKLENGKYSTVLGKIVNMNFDFNQQLWIRIGVFDLSTCGDVDFGPYELTSSPYSLAPWNISGNNITYNSGNVGIGAVNPDAKLTIGAPPSSSPPAQPYDLVHLYNRNENIAQISFITSFNAAAWRYTGTDGTNNNQRMGYLNGDHQEVFSILNDGKVGIGMVTPAYTLHLYTPSGSALNTQLKLEADDLGGGGGAEILLDRASGPRAAQLQFQLQNTTQWSMGVLRNGGNTTNAFAISSNSDLNNGGREFVISDGNVGIGTVTPAYTLHLYTPASSALNTQLKLEADDLGGGGGAEILLDRASGPRAAQLQFQLQNTTQWSMGVLRYGGNSTNAFAISSNPDLSVGGKEFVIQGSRIGLGTYDPQARLHLMNSDSTKAFVITGTPSNKENFLVYGNGLVYAREVNVTMEYFPDYVFEKDYNLMPLEQLGKYVDDNKHLPEIPSANEIKQSGLSVGEFQAKLLQKVEELTLYVIKLDEQNKSLRERIDKYEKH